MFCVGEQGLQPILPPFCKRHHYVSGIAFIRLLLKYFSVLKSLTHQSDYMLFYKYSRSITFLMMKGIASITFGFGLLL